MSSVRISAPGAVRVPLGTPPWVAAPALRVVHVGQSAAILAPIHRAAAGTLTAVTSARRGLVPGGICVPGAAEFATLRTALAQATDRTVVDLSSWEHSPPERIDRVDLRLRPLPVRRRAVDRLTALLRQEPVGRYADSVLDPRPLRALAAPLTAAALAGADETVARLAGRLVGAGPGATPTGDDVLVGVLAGLDVAAGVLLPAAAARRTRARIAAALVPLLPRTTAAARHDLAAACSGRFSEHVHSLVGALTDPAAVPAAVTAARTWGATSGLDLAAGAAVTLSSLPRRSAARPAAAAPAITLHRRSA